MELSILICTRNGEASIAEAIACIAKQVNVDANNYEVIVVDNGSADRTKPTAAVALQTLPCRTRLIDEPREGKLSALLRGIVEAEGSLISIVDDDNLIGEDFVFHTINLFKCFPEVGIAGSVNALSAVQTPDWFHLTAGRFGCSVPFLCDEVRQIDEFTTIASGGVIAGAGSTFRKQPLKSAIEAGFTFMNNTYRGKNLKSVTGEDTELCYLYRHLGYWFGSDTRITLQHKIDPSRLSWSYARQLAGSIGAGALAIDAFFLLHDEHQDSPLRNKLRANWWWMAFRRVGKAARLLPAVARAKLRRIEIDPVWLTWDVEMGALRRILAERGEYTQKLRAMRTAKWTQLRGKFGASPDCAQ